MAMYSEGGTSHPDLIIGLFYVACVSLGLVLNTLVFLSNMRPPYTLPRVLFSLLSVTDFLTCGVVAVFGAFHFLRPGTPQCSALYDTTGLGVVRCRQVMPPSIALKLYGIAAWFLTQSPGVFTALLATCRLIQIMKPFTVIKIRAVVMVVVAYITVTLALLFSWFITNDVMFTYYILNVWPLHDRLLNGLMSSDHQRTRVFLILISLYMGNILGQLTALIASLITITHLCRSPSRWSRVMHQPSRQRRRQSGTTIMVTNIGAVLQLIGIVVINKMIFGFDWNTTRPADSETRSLVLGSCNMLLPVVMSVYNPIVFIMYTPKFLARQRKRCHAKFVVNYQNHEAVTTSIL